VQRGTSVNNVPKEGGKKPISLKTKAYSRRQSQRNPHFSMKRERRGKRENVGGGGSCRGRVSWPAVSSFKKK